MMINKEIDFGLMSLISTVYHELWHVNTWKNDKLIKQLRNEVSEIVVEFDKMSKQLFYNDKMEDIEKAGFIRELIVKYTF